MECRLGCSPSPHGRLSDASSHEIFPMDVIGGVWISDCHDRSCVFHISGQTSTLRRSADNSLARGHVSDQARSADVIV